MKALVNLRQKAEILRKQGFTYNEILKQVPVSKSSLSDWLADFPLTKSEKHLLKKRKDANISLGRIRAAAAHKETKSKSNQRLFQEAVALFELHKAHPLFHTGVALYWAEGAKRNDMFHFMNSDSEMVEVMIRWLEVFTKYKRTDLGFRLYLHAPFVNDDWETWWQKQLCLRRSQFKKTIIKPSGLGFKKRPNYKGCIRVEVPKSSHLLVKMKFWMNMLVEYHTKQ